MQGDRSVVHTAFGSPVIEEYTINYGSYHDLKYISGLRGFGVSGKLKRTLEHASA